jgi:hypothetical protein
MLVWFGIMRWYGGDADHSPGHGEDQHHDVPMYDVPVLCGAVAVLCVAVAVRCVAVIARFCPSA